MGIIVAALCVIALALTTGAMDAARAKVQPTPCPDTIACHALKRMPTQQANSASSP